MKAAPFPRARPFFVSGPAGSPRGGTTARPIFPYVLSGAAAD